MIFLLIVWCLKSCNASFEAYRKGRLSNMDWLLSVRSRKRSIHNFTTFNWLKLIHVWQPALSLLLKSFRILWFTSVVHHFRVIITRHKRALNEFWRSFVLYGKNWKIKESVLSLKPRSQDFLPWIAKEQHGNKAVRCNLSESFRISIIFMLFSMFVNFCFLFTGSNYNKVSFERQSFVNRSGDLSDNNNIEQWSFQLV